MHYEAMRAPSCICRIRLCAAPAPPWGRRSTSKRCIVFVSYFRELTRIRSFFLSCCRGGAVKTCGNDR